MSILLPRRARCVLSSLHCNGHNLLLKLFVSLESTKSRILHAAPAVIRPRILFISFCTVQLPILCAARFFFFLFAIFKKKERALAILSTTSSAGPGKLPGFWSSIVFHHAPIPRKGSSNNKCVGLVVQICCLTLRGVLTYFDDF